MKSDGRGMLHRVAKCRHTRVGSSCCMISLLKCSLGDKLAPRAPIGNSRARMVWGDAHETGL